MALPTICVVIPCYNRREELTRALSGLERQTDPDFDVIVCDDGSTDDIPGVVRGFADRLTIRCISIENSGGPARPRNTGVHSSGAEWISFLDSDDWWFPDRMSQVRGALNADVDVVYHRLRKHACDKPGDAGTPLAEFVAHDLDQADPLRTMIRRSNPVATSGATVRREALLAMGGFCEDRSLASVEDFDLWLRLAAAGYRFRYLPEVLGAYCVGGDQISNFSTQYDRQRALFERQLDLLPASYRAMAASKFEYLLGSYAQRLDRPGAADHFGRVGLAAGWMVWAKARCKQLTLHR